MNFSIKNFSKQIANSAFSFLPNSEARKLRQEEEQDTLFAHLALRTGLGDDPAKFKKLLEVRQISEHNFEKNSSVS